METYDVCHLCGVQRALNRVILENMEQDGLDTDSKECSPDCLGLVVRRVLSEAQDEVGDSKPLEDSFHI